MTEYDYYVENHGEIHGPYTEPLAVSVRNTLNRRYQCAIALAVWVGFFSGAVVGEVGMLQWMAGMMILSAVVVVAILRLFFMKPPDEL